MPSRSCSIPFRGASVFIALILGAPLVSCGPSGDASPQSAAAPPAPPTGAPHGQPPQTARSEPAAPPLDWRSLEAPLLTNHVQLTFRDKFLRAGEAYFSPDQRWIIFQAIPVPDASQEPAAFYSMYVAKLRRDGAGKISALEEPFMVNPPGSANTCGWFHPTQKARVLYGSTMGPPADNQPAGFQVGTRSYRWQFPVEMEIVTQTVNPIAKDYGLTAGAQCGTDFLATTVFSREEYDAECSYSADGRFILYTHVQQQAAPAGQGKLADADIWVYDTKTTRHLPLVVAPGYDGGPFFSPDGKRLCYRSDRKRNDLLQIYTADLVFDASGAPSGIVNEQALTSNEHVNWAPYWHPSGNFLIYGTSQVNHANYEVFAIAAPPLGGRPDRSLQPRRITIADGADVLPVFSPDGKYMMWTSQRGPKAEGEQRSSSQLWAAEWLGGETLPN